MCFINLDSIFRVYQLHCQILLESNNQIYISELNSINGDLGYTLGMKNYVNNIPIKILINDYTIYVLMELIDSQNKKNVMLYSCSIDFGLSISFYTGFPFPFYLHLWNLPVPLFSDHALPTLPHIHLGCILS